MTTLEQVITNLNQAQKEKNDLVVLTLRQIKSTLDNAKIANNRKDLAEEQVIKILKSEVKKRKEAAELYNKGDRKELAEKEQKEVEIISKYLPAELSEDDVRQKIKEILAEVGDVGPADFGKVMGQVMSAMKGSADGGVVNKIVKEELALKE